jgi:hypothetical protein
MSLFEENQKLIVENQNEVVMLWVGDKIPELQQLSIKSLLLTNHNVNFYTYKKFTELEQFKDFPNFNNGDANDIVNEKDIWTYKVSAHGKGSYAGFANHWRLIYLLKNGGTWVDSDIIAIKNVVDFGKNKIMIASELPDRRRSIDNACNGFLSFPKGDVLVEEMEKLCSDVGSDARFGQTGPTGLKKCMRIHRKYEEYLLSHEAICPVPSYNYKHYSSMTPEEVYKENNLDHKDIYGFHIWNTRFSYHKPRKNNLEDTLMEGSLYDCLKTAVLSSNTLKEYQEKLRSYNIIN